MPAKNNFNDWNENKKFAHSSRGTFFYDNTSLATVLPDIHNVQWEKS